MQDFSFLPTLGKESDWIICEDQKKNTYKYKYKSPGNPTEYSLDFKLDTMPITSCDKYFYKLFESDFKNAENKFDEFMDSDMTNEIIWGDMGIANFFINQEDLAKLDFSNVFYNWDCS